MADIKIEQALSGIGDCLDLVASGFSELKTKLEEIETSLGNNEWQGGSYQNCVDINTLIGDYRLMLQPYCYSVKRHCVKLISDVDLFDIRSTNVVSIKNIPL